MGNAIGRGLDRIELNPLTHLADTMNESIKEAQKMLEEMLSKASTILREIIREEGNKLIDNFFGQFWKFIFGLLFLLLVLVGGAFASYFAYQSFFVDPEEAEKVYIKLDELDKFYFAMKPFIVSAYGQIPCAFTQFNLIFGLVLPCLFFGHFIGSRQQRVDEGGPNRQNAPRANVPPAADPNVKPRWR